MGSVDYVGFLGERFSWWPGVNTVSSPDEPGVLCIGGSTASIRPVAKALIAEYSAEVLAEFPVLLVSGHLWAGSVRVTPKDHLVDSFKQRYWEAGVMEAMQRSSWLDREVDPVWRVVARQLPAGQRVWLERAFHAWEGDGVELWDASLKV